ncbi:uncharacterized protein [Onthophagus taurus]|uniref:uncharacterized protein n=1 Tax=Onthophagus taurus TaxID=166361 RepID=UPI000C2032FB|nr:uncharacterized protein LOC111422883 [Onthophagus taurus]
MSFKMALLDRCFCCNLAIGCGFLGIYLLIAYLIAFAFELIWILESHNQPPTVAILLCAGYFTLALFAALLVHGLATKNTFCLVAWMISVTILTFPEAGLVIYLSIQYWRIETIYGMTELACWLARIVANVIGFVAIQSLYTIWKEEELVDKRLRDLNMTAVTLPRDPASLGALSAVHGYQNNAYDSSYDHVNNLKRATSMPLLWNTAVPNNLGPFLFDGYQFCTTSEFNASVFVPKSSLTDGSNEAAVKKSQSLMDLRILEDHPIIEEKLAPIYPQWTPGQFLENDRTYPGYTLSLNRRTSSKMTKFASLDNLNEDNKGSHIIQHRTGFYAQPIENYGVPIYYGPLDGPDFLIYKKQIDKFNSKNSLSNTSTDDVQKYRDVAL